VCAVGAARAFREGVLVEALNPKTAAFFLAFIPQFIEPAGGHPALQFMALGLISVALNTLADVVVVVMAATARHNLARRPRLLQRLRQGSGLFIAGLGISPGNGTAPSELAQGPRMHPPGRMIAPDLLSGALAALSSAKIAKHVAPEPDIRTSFTPADSPSADSTSVMTG